jgi:hypothetical protein
MFHNYNGSSASACGHQYVTVQDPTTVLDGATTQINHNFFRSVMVPQTYSKYRNKNVNFDNIFFYCFISEFTNNFNTRKFGDHPWTRQFTYTVCQNLSNKRHDRALNSLLQACARVKLQTNYQHFEQEVTAITANSTD